MAVFYLFIRFCSVLASILVTSGCCATSSAQNGEPDPARFTFRFDRGELDSVAGVDRLYGRLTRDARRACYYLGKGGELWRVDSRNACQAELLEKIVDQSGAPALVARHQDKD
jgi:UrcA family protein